MSKELLSMLKKKGFIGALIVDLNLKSTQCFSGSESYLSWDLRFVTWSCEFLLCGQIFTEGNGNPARRKWVFMNELLSSLPHKTDVVKQPQLALWNSDKSPRSNRCQSREIIIISYLESGSGASWSPLNCRWMAASLFSHSLSWVWARRWASSGLRVSHRLLKASRCCPAWAKLPSSEMQAWWKLKVKNKQAC